MAQITASAIPAYFPSAPRSVLLMMHGPVTIHTGLTPAEARELAYSLLEAADKAEAPAALQEAA